MRATRVIIAGVLLAGLALALTTTPARAATFTYTTDFNGFPAGWENDNYCGEAITEYTGPTINNRPAVIGGYGDGSVLSTQYGRKFAVSFALDEPVTITQVTLDGGMEGNTTETHYLQVLGCDSSNNVIANVSDTGDPTSINETVSWASVAFITIYTAPSSGLGLCLLDAESGYGTTPPCFYEWADNLSITADAATDPFDGVGGSGGGEILYRPVSTDDTLEVSTASQPNIITAVSDAWVHAAASGVVTSISPTGGSNHVTVESVDYAAEYSNLAFVYAEVGDTIAGGCILGRVGDQILATSATYSYPVGQVGFAIDDGGGPMAWQAWPDATSSSGCSDSNATANCLTANPKLNDYASRWSTTGQPTNESVILDTGEKLAQYLTLTASTNYYLTIIASSASGSATIPGNLATIKYTLGDVEGTVSFDKDADYAILEIGPITPTLPDLLPDVYALTLLIPAESQAVNITFVCLHDGSAQVAPEACYFPNWHFGRQGTGGWTLSAGAVDAAPLRPFVSLPQNETISHPIVIYGYTDADADYRLRVVGRTDVNDVSFTFSDIAQYISTGFQTDLTVSYDVSGVPVETLANIDILNVVIFREYRNEFTVPEDATWDGDLVATNDTATADDIEIQAICLAPASGVWPGYEAADSPGANRDCSVPQTPVTLNPAEWVGYSVEIILWLWYCVISPIIASIAAGVSAAIIGLGMMGRWLGSLVAVSAGFALGLAIGAGQALLSGFAVAVGAAWAVLSDFPFIQLAYDLLGLLGAAGVLMAVITGDLLGFLASVGGYIGVFTAMSVNGWLGLVDAINSGTAPAIGAPNCGNPSDPLIGLCYGLDAIGEVVTEFPALTASTYVMSGSIGLRTIIWTVRTFGKVIGDV